MAAYTVLIPLDGSPLAEHSLTYLQSLSKMGDLAVHLLSVVDETEEIHDLTSTEVVEREGHVLTTYLNQITADVERVLGLKATPEVRVGVPMEAIEKHAAELKPDLMVISTHGRSGLSRWRHGSVATRLLHAASCPILIVGPKAAGEWSKGVAAPTFDSILVPLDGSELAEEALSTAATISQAHGSKIHLVRTVRLRVAGDPATGAASIDLTTQLEEGAASYLAKVRERLVAGGDVVAEVRMGAPATELEEYISKEGINLVVMTSHGRSGLVRAALGSVTDRLAGNGNAPVFIVRSPN